jgi:hypothetical protein
MIALLYILIEVQGFYFPKPSRLQSQSILKMNIEDKLVKFIEDDRKWKKEWKAADEKFKADQKLERKEFITTLKKIEIIYEDVVRHKLVQSRGDDFGRPFKILNLWCLARLALPKDFTLTPLGKMNRKRKPLSKNSVVKVEPATVNILHQERTMELAKAALVHLPDLVLWAEENRNSTAYGMARKLGLFDQAYSGFKKQKTKTSQLKFLMDSPLGIYLLSRETLLCPSKLGFITEYETDIRGSVELGERYLFVKCGEVKTGNDDRKLAIKQLIKRLSIIRCALQHLLTDKQRQRIVILLTGVIYSMVEGWSSTEEQEIAKLAKEIGIKVGENSISVVAETLR